MVQWGWGFFFSLELRLENIPYFFVLASFQ